MPPQAVVTRERASFSVCQNDWNPGEIFFEVYNFAIAVAQFVACFGFFTDAGPVFYETACVIFAVTCFLGAIQSGSSILEIRAHFSEDMTADEKSHNRRERAEGWMYLIGGLAFVVGAILFLPVVYEHDERNDLTAGTWLFVLGSLLFWFATFVNSLSVIVHHMAVHSINERIHVYGIVTLGFGQFGSIAFITGSFFYFPQVDCEECDWNTIDVGTYLYVLGAALFMVAAASNVLLAIAKQRLKGRQMNDKQSSAEATKVADDDTQSSLEATKVADETLVIVASAEI